jgi:hypothetical protein
MGIVRSADWDREPLFPIAKPADEPNDWTKFLLGRAGLRGSIADPLRLLEIEDWFGSHLPLVPPPWLADLAADAETVLAGAQPRPRVRPAGRVALR